LRTLSEVIIIGGDIQGISPAYCLAERSLTDACVLEMEMLGGGSSGKSASVIGRTYSAWP